MVERSIIYGIKYIYSIVILQTCHLFSYVQNFTPLPSKNFRFICTQNDCVRVVYTPIFYQIPFRKSAFFSDRKILAIGKDSISGKRVFRIFCDQLRFDVSLLNHSFR
jgi:hypothetical protein